MPYKAPGEIPICAELLHVWGCVLNGTDSARETAGGGMEGGREGQETGLNPGRGGQLCAVGGGRLPGEAVPATSGLGWWVVAGGKACWGRPAPVAAKPSRELCPLSEYKPGTYAAGESVTLPARTSGGLAAREPGRLFTPVPSTWTPFLPLFVA